MIFGRRTKLLTGMRSAADPHHFWKVDPDPHQSGKLDPDPDQHRSENVEALKSLMEHWRVQTWEKASFRIRIKLKGRIRIRLTLMRIRDTAGMPFNCTFTPPFSF
jgi:hypothetical protein